MFRFSFILCFLFTVLLNGQDWQEKHIHSQAERILSRIQATQYPDDSTIDVTYYGLSFTVAVNPIVFTGNVTVNFTSVKPSASVSLDFSSALTIDSFFLNGAPAVYTFAGNKLKTQFTGTSQAGQRFSIRVVYHGIPIATGFGSFSFSSTPSGAPAIFTLSEPYGAKDWFPCKDTPADKADSADIRIRTAQDLLPVSNGALADTINHGDGTHTWHWHSGYPIAHYLLSLAIAPYSVFTQQFQYAPGKTFPVMHFIYPESYAALKPGFEKTTDMLAAFSYYYGEYPFAKEKYGHAQFGWGGGMEHQTISSVSGSYDALVAHELSHQWFGDKVTCARWQDIWLNEGFASFSESLYREWSEGKASYKSHIASRMETAKLATGTVSVQDITSLGEIFSGYRSYHKGQIIVHMLRGVLGDTLFFKMLKGYLGDPLLAYNSATTEDLQRVAEKYYGKNLAWFFKQWVYGTGYPKYEISRSSAGTTNVLSINQLQQEPLFIMPLQIKLLTLKGDTTITLFNDKRYQTVTVVTPSPVTSVEFDPDNLIMKEAINLGEIRKNDFRGFDISVFPNPGYTGQVIALSVSEPQIITTELISLQGSVLHTTGKQSFQPGVYKIPFNTAALSAGVYFLRATGNNATQVFKFVKY